MTNIPRVKWITDTTSDITPEKASQLGIELLPIPITIGDKGYFEGRDFTPQEFYKILLDSRELPATSRITAPVFEETYRRLADEGYTDAIHVTINGRGSGTHEAAQMACQNFQKKDPARAERLKIHLFDSRAYSYAYGHVVLEGARRARDGAAVEELLAFVEDWLSHAVIHLSCYTLDFAKRSGRISSTAAFVGELLGLRPIIRMAGGGNEVIDKVRGDKNVVPALCEWTCKNIADGGAYYIMKGMSAEPAQELGELLTKRLGYPPLGVHNLGPSVSINAGPKAIATVVYGKGIV